MVRKWYGSMLGVVLGICLFLQGMEGKWLCWMAFMLLLVNGVLVLSYHYTNERRFREGVREILFSGEVNEERNRREKNKLYLLDAATAYIDMIVILASLVFLLENWGYFIAYFHLMNKYR